MRRVVVLGMMAKTPVPGVVWQTLHYLLGLRSLGLDPYYVEAHARTPSMLMERPTDDGSARAAAFIAAVLGRYGLSDRWAYQALHDDGRTLGMSERQLATLYREAELIINLHGGTEPRPEMCASGRLVYLETDPVQLQIELHDGRESTMQFLDAHCAHFTFAENLGTDACSLPVCDRFQFLPTRQPVVLDCWQGASELADPRFTTVGNWRQPWRNVRYQGEAYGWSKDVQWEKFLDLPARTGAAFELALSGHRPGDQQRLEQRGWRVRPALDLDVDSYRDYIASSFAEFTVAKEQNIRFATGWFSDRSATYLAAGRPVITQDTGFGHVLPTGEGLFAVSDIDQAAAAVEEIAADHRRHSRAAREIAHDHFAAERVLGELLEQCGVTTRRPTLTQPPQEPASGRPHRRHRLGPDSSVLALIPHFRCEEWLEDCLESMVRQTRPVDAIVVIDDASGEPPLSLVQRFPQVTLLHADRNVGPYRLVQQVIENTRYDAYLFQDADDWSAPNRLELLLRYAEETGAELIGTQEIRVFCDEPEVAPIRWPLDVHAQFDEKPTAFPLLHPTSLVSRDLVMELGGFASGLRFSGDAEFLRRARFVSRVVNIPHHAYYRRIRQGSLTTAPETGLQSPERKRVMEMLWERARTNAELVAAGSEPELEPCAVAPAVGLAHLAGPALDGSRAPAPVKQAIASRSGGPVFVIGADRSGVSALACALGQHDAVTELADGAWLGDLAAAVEDVRLAALASDGAGLGQQPLSAEEFAGRFGGPAGELAAGGAGRWVDGSWKNTFAVERLARLFPDARFVHLVRDVDSAVAVMVDPPLGSAGATGGTQVPARLRAKLDEPEAIDRWMSAGQACVEAEDALGADRVLRLSFDELVEAPERALRSCLDFLGEPYARECLRPLRGLRARKLHPGATVGSDGEDGPRQAARRLSASLLDSPQSVEAGRSRIRTVSRQATSEILAAHVPAGSMVAVVSRGDHELLNVAHCDAVHFPQDDAGNWLGFHPQDDDAAIRSLERIHARGARFLFIPGTSRWWLEYYGGLRQLLEQRHETVLDSEYGTLFELAADGASEPGDAPARASEQARGPRVVLVTDHFPKFSETFFAHEVSGLLERGWDVHVLCNRSNRDQWRYFPQLAGLLESGERIHVISDFEAQLAELRPDVVHFGYGTLALGRMHVRELLGCRVVVSLRGYDINYFGLEDPHCYDDVWDAADLLHLVSDDVWRRAQRRGCPADKQHRVITDAISVEQFAQVDRDHGAVGTAERPLRVVSVGRLHWKKGYEYGLAAVRQLLDWGADVRYRIVGDGPDREAIMFAIHDLGLEQHVELLGAQTASQVREALGWADVCLHAAVSEGFCVSVIEAQATGLPVVCSDADGLGENVEHRVSGLVVPRRDAAALASGLAELASRPQLRATMGAAARDRAQRRFDIAGQLDALESLYREAIAAAPGAGGEDALDGMERELSALEIRRQALAKEVRARHVARRTREDVSRLIPPSATVLVVSRGDERLVDLEQRVGWHFPQAEGGVYAGHHPADSRAAIDHLQELCARGADHLVIPATSAWWLEHYTELRDHLEQRHVELAADPDSCVIYRLRAEPADIGRAA